MTSLVLPVQNIVSASLPDGELEVFSRSWRLQVTAAGAVATFVVPSGGALVVTFGGVDPATRTIAGSTTSLWLTGVTAQQLLPPLDETSAPPGGFSLPI